MATEHLPGIVTGDGWACPVPWRSRRQCRGDADIQDFYGKLLTGSGGAAAEGRNEPLPIVICLILVMVSNC